MEFDKVGPSDEAVDRRVAAEKGPPIGEEEGDDEQVPLTSVEQRVADEALGKPLASSLPGEARDKKPLTDKEVRQLIDKARGVIQDEGGYNLFVNKRGYLTMRVTGGGSRSFGRYDPRVEGGIKDLLSPSEDAPPISQEEAESRPSKLQVQAVKAQNTKLWEHKQGGQKGATQPLLDSIISSTVWMQEAINKVGFITVLTVMQTKGIQDGGILTAIDQLDSPDQFVGYIREGLMNLAAASQDASYIGELQGKLKVETAKEAFLEFNLLPRLTAERDEALSKFRMAISTMCANDLRVFTEKDVFRRVTDSVSSQPQSLIQQQQPRNGNGHSNGGIER